MSKKVLLFLMSTILVAFAATGCKKSSGATTYSTDDVSSVFVEGINYEDMVHHGGYLAESEADDFVKLVNDVLKDNNKADSITDKYILSTVINLNDNKTVKVLWDIKDKNKVSIDGTIYKLTDKNYAKLIDIWTKLTKYSGIVNIQTDYKLPERLE